MVTKEEYKKAKIVVREYKLIKEAKRRGFFKKGNKFVSKFSDGGAIREVYPYDLTKGLTYTTRFDGYKDLRSDGGIKTFDVFCSNPLIYKDGEWCDVIKNK